MSGSWAESCTAVVTAASEIHMKKPLVYPPHWILWGGIIGLFLVDKPIYLVLCGVAIGAGVLMATEEKLQGRIYAQDEVIEKLNVKVNKLEDRLTNLEQGYEEPLEK